MSMPLPLEKNYTLADVLEDCIIDLSQVFGGPQMEGSVNFMDERDYLKALDGGLAEIEQSLHLMLALAQMSASNLDLDRDALQATLERLQHKIDCIADGWRKYRAQSRLRGFSSNQTICR